MEKGIPKKDGSGKGNRENKGRNNCDNIESTGKGRNGKSPGRGRNRR